MPAWVQAEVSPCHIQACLHCSLQFMALRLWSPQVCWNLPLRPPTLGQEVGSQQGQGLQALPHEAAPWDRLQELRPGQRGQLRAWGCTDHGGRTSWSWRNWRRVSEMKGLLMLAWLLVCSAPAALGGFLELRSMIKEVTGKDALMEYGFYGCYCGWGGQGTPKDATDWCCWVHDHCYGLLEKKGCNIRTQYYKYRFSRGLVTCEPGPRCQVQLCACDRKLVYCLKRNLRSYNPDYQYFPNFFCT